MVSTILPNLLISNERRAERILSSAASVRSSDWEVTKKEGEIFVSILDKSPPPTLCVDPPETLELLSLQGQSVNGVKTIGRFTHNFDDTE